MLSVKNAMSPNAPRVFAFICDRSSRIESLAVMPGMNVDLEAGCRFLDTVKMLGDTSLEQLWQELAAGRPGIQGQVEVPLVKDGPAIKMLFHAMPLHQGHDDGMFLVTLCIGFQAISTGPDEIIRSRAVLDTAVDSIITINSAGQISSINPATVRMFGYSDVELVGRNISMLMPEPFRSSHDGYIARYLETGAASIIGVGRQVSGRKKSGREFPAHLAVSEFTFHGMRYFTGILRDLSELEQVQKQLMQAERLAAIGQMVTGLAHESRNALQRARACLDMLSLDLQGNADQLDLARRATTAIQDLYRLYEEVRSYAAPIHLEFRRCDIATIWRKEWDNLTSVRKEKHIQLVEAADNESIVCEVDVHRLEQVFRNVLENALHACRETGTITIRCKSTEWEGQPAVCVVVQDDGIGMTEDIANQIFEPFFTTKQRGTGLGMAIVQRIITAHAGCISARAVKPCGAEIQLILPCQAQIRNAVRF